MFNYFRILSKDLQQANFTLPTLIVDHARLDVNLAQIKLMLPSTAQPRLVVKSLASIELLKYIAKDLNCNRFMVFHLPHIALIVNTFPQADILLGKPMPVKAMQLFYEQHKDTAQARIQWLVDSLDRLQQCLDLAKKIELKQLVSIELDIGLHRGGIQDLEHFRELLKLIQDNPKHLQLSGFMGYDAHVGKIPKLIKSVEKTYEQSQAQYQKYISCLSNEFSSLNTPNLCFNGAGSPTFSLHTKHSVCNDLSFGSMLLKPLDFDIPTLVDFQSALWIATPVLKKLPITQIPGLELLDNAPHHKNALFVYGGNWMADYVYPEGTQTNVLYGRSSNQELINVSKSSDIQIDDFVFLQPTQSEAVISQFEQIWLYRGQHFTPWNTFMA